MSDTTKSSPSERIATARFGPERNSCLLLLLTLKFSPHCGAAHGTTLVNDNPMSAVADSERNFHVTNLNTGTLLEDFRG